MFQNHTTDTNNCDAICTNRSEIWALIKELTNKRKKELNIKNIDAHVLEDKFEDQYEYIRANLSCATIITDKCWRRKLCVHDRRILRILKIKKTLREEYNLVGKLRYCIVRQNGKCYGNVY
ncbi:Late expression facto 11 [Lonomia obliqua multiple nucleopolyhedrovirus]|uniref:Late expression factor 11 n=1 Tax=Lonomia obliqua multiple nucleopolyhedrovirus TaxID=134394 RepID=A0A126FC81_9ABAC|nr:Late expression facto 11 [Lonomia obliqua multiple nucleopolyhedrovirus]AKN81000.1 Late expression facto 11 [Lonomia obliqua multiple nucleopolyhedrovirus]